MICPGCNKECEDRDFLMKQVVCYRCMYRLKTEKDKKTKKERKKIFCRQCDKEILTDKYSKKRQRTIYCSQECYTIAHKIMAQNYWTKALREKVQLQRSYGM